MTNPASTHVNDVHSSEQVSSLVARLQPVIESAFEAPSQLTTESVAEAVRESVALLDAGLLRVATPPMTHEDDVAVGLGARGPVEPVMPAAWTVHAWLKKAVLLYFRIAKMEVSEVGPFEYHDKIPLKRGFAKAGVRVVPPATVRYGSHVAEGAVLMPSYVNIGAYVGAGSMVDTWATVGSCAQIGRDVHLSGGVGIGGVLEPPGATPVIVEDGAFIGSRAIVVEGVHVGREAVLGANVVVTASTPVVDVTGISPREWKGYIPPRAVVIPGVRNKGFSAGQFGVPCALVIGHRTENTDRKVSLNAALRDFGVSV